MQPIGFFDPVARTRLNRTRLFDPGDRHSGTLGRGTLGRPLRPAVLVAWRPVGVLLRRCRLLRLALAGRVAGPGDGLADQFLDRADRLVVGGCHDGDGRAAAARPAGAADAMDLVVGVMRDVEIDHVTDVGNVESAGRHIGRDQQRDFALTELVEGRRPRRLIQVAVQRGGVEAMPQQ
jgi:hypothetical protein